MGVEYCNVTSDLVDVYGDVEDYRNLRGVSGFVSVGGGVYRLKQSGFVEMVYEDGIEMIASASSGTSSATPTPAAGEFSYDPAADVLYVRMSDSAAPSTHTVESGPDWDVLKTRMRNDAQEELESLLAANFVIPFQRIIEPAESYNDRGYDEGIRRAAATLTVVRLIRRVNPESEVAAQLYKLVNYPRFAPNEEGAPGWVQRVLRGEVSLKIQRTARQTGGFDVIEGSANAGTGFLRVSGRYTGSKKQVWRVQVDGAGDVGTATYKLSLNGGSGWTQVLQLTREASSNNRRVWLADAVFGEFAGTFGEGDSWDIVLYPVTDGQQVRTVTSVRLSRG